jgi:hypothetical protein
MPGSGPEQEADPFSPTGNIGDNEVYIPLVPRDERSKHIVCKAACCCVATSFCIASLALVAVLLSARRP